MAQQQQAARQAAVFGGATPGQTMNKQINEQLASLSERISAINDQFGLG